MEHAINPGSLIREAMESRGWSQRDLAIILGRPLPAINEVIKGRRAISPEMAVSLAAAFGIDAARLLHMEADYRLSQLGHMEPRLSGARSYSRSLPSNTWRSAGGSEKWIRRRSLKSNCVDSSVSNRSISPRTWPLRFAEPRPTRTPVPLSERGISAQSNSPNPSRSVHSAMRHSTKGSGNSGDSLVGRKKREECREFSHVWAYASS